MAHKKLQIGIVGRQRMGARHPIHFLNRTPRAELTATSTSNANEIQRAKKHLVPYGVTTVQTLRRDAQAQRLASRDHCLRGHRTRKASHQNRESQQLHSAWNPLRTAVRVASKHYARNNRVGIIKFWYEKLAYMYASRMMAVGQEDQTNIAGTKVKLAANIK